MPNSLSILLSGHCGDLLAGDAELDGLTGAWQHAPLRPAPDSDDPFVDRCHRTTVPISSTLTKHTGRAIPCRAH
ncbi:hypothetical protein SKAU_G00350180 [Synaphobranchus kaupii]|uniref:Uncharacterized protein n=1 Tax=Synaphobranchus kaupii TaxID=118154 RepID=A0A9Q1EKD1_SYNKA|nr:hypothetical protein SKAU_G00350180 [Synaphobranchus kaupii]